MSLCECGCGKDAGAYAKHGKKGNPRRYIKGHNVADTNRKYASARMVSNNPMHDAATRQRVSDTMKGRKPSVHGGNGNGLTAAEQALSEATGLLPYVVLTHMKRYSGYPAVYKLDLADPQRKLGIEVDGKSHCVLSQQVLDRKKENLLRTLGWTILRFTNKQALEETAECARKVKEEQGTVLNVKPTA